MSGYPVQVLLAVGWDARSVIVAVTGDHHAREDLAEQDDEELAAFLAREEGDEPTPTAGLYVWEGTVEFATYPAGDYGGPPYECSADYCGQKRRAMAKDLADFEVCE